MIQIANTVGISDRPMAKSRGPAPDDADKRREELARKKPIGKQIEDEEEDPAEDEPVRRRRLKKRKKEKKSAGMLIAVGMISLFLLLLVGGGGGFAAWWFWPRNNDPMKFMPDNCEMILSLKWDELEHSPAYQDLVKSPAWHNFNDLQAHLHQNNALVSAGIVRIWRGERSRVIAFGNPSASEDYIQVIQTKNAIKIDDFLSGDGGTAAFTKEKVGWHTMYVSANDAVCLVDSKTLLVASKKETLRSVLDRDKEPALSDGLKAALDKVNFSKPFVLAASSKGQLQTRGPAVQDPFGFAKAGEQVDGLAVHADVDTDINMSFTIFCKSAKSATDFKSSWDKMLALLRTLPGVPKEGMDLLAGIRLNIAGSNIEGTAAFKTKTLVKLFEMNANPRGNQ
jgi:hypothetical protein